MVIAILGTVVLLAGAIVLGYTAFEPEKAPCYDDERAMNPLSGGVYQPRTEVFDSVSDAEAFICRGVPELEADNWTLDHIEATRTVPTEFLVEGAGAGWVTLGYQGPAAGESLVVDSAPYFGGLSYFAAQIPEPNTTATTQVQGVEATVYRFGINPDQVVVLWRLGSLEHRATAQLSDALTLEQLVATLNTLQ